MYPVYAPEAHLQPRQLWDSITSALGNAFAVDDEETASTSTKYVTKTVTAGQTPTTTAKTNAKTTKTTATPKATTTSLPTRTTSSSSLPTAFVLPTDATTSDTTLALAPAPSTTKTPEATRELADQVTTTSAARASATTAVDKSTEDSNNVAKAGIAIGVLAGVLVVVVLAWVLFNRRRKRMEQKHLQDDDEKIHGPMNPFADSAAIRTPTNAPRLSLRPVTQFLPNLSSLPDRRTSRGAGLMLSVPEQQESQLHKPTGGSAWERPTVNSTMSANGWDRPETSMSSNSANPFNDTQRIAEDPQGRPISPPSPFQGQANLAAAPSGYSPEPVSPIEGPEKDAAFGAAAGAAAAGAAAGLVRKASIRKDLPRPLDLTMPLPPPAPMSAVPPSPARTDFSVSSVAPGQPIGPSASAAAIAAAGGPPQSTVHRVTLDFKPTLEDEMGLTAGQLVRLLHEYDDGWALCIRLDRSQQGVVPRTCLSTRPVKPRPPPQGGPRGPPVNPTRPGYPPRPGMNPRGPPPNGPYGRPQSPAGPMGAPHGRQSPNGGRPMSPAGGRPMSPYSQRPASPAGRSQSPGPRSQSPGPRYQQQGRPQSPSGMGRRMSPPGPSHMAQQQQPQQQMPGQAY